MMGYTEVSGSEGNSSSEQLQPKSSPAHLNGVLPLASKAAAASSPENSDRMPSNGARLTHPPVSTTSLTVSPRDSNADDSASSSSSGDFFPLDDSAQPMVQTNLRASDHDDGADADATRSTSSDHDISYRIDAEEIAQEEASKNERLLCTAFVSFLSFALVQLSFAVVAGSQAMTGDAAAMIVDALTYLFNWVAERRKNHLDSLVAGRSNPARTRRKLELQMEIIPPFVSVVTLVIVIVLVLRKSIHILLLDRHRSRSQQGNPNVGLMMIFSVLNLFLDALNVYCFAQASHLTGYSVSNSDEDDEERTNGDDPNHRHHRTKQSYRELDAQTNDGLDDAGLELPDRPSPPIEYRNSEYGDSVLTSRPSHASSAGEDGAPDGLFRREGQHGHANLNMCSAFTHVFADTLRSVAVIVAAGFAEIFPSAVTHEEADSSAAVVVSVMILLSLIPLLKGLLLSLSELQAIRAAERSDAMFSIPP
jgi:Co/Zn/Cd efflux system component